ncbi:MAG: tetratricopeptide repeat protein [Methylococcaceae bacterium]|nr:tetratricopeptide repeat protein [Methylococcaceae bacterium]MDZ4155712.1 tetratricopeptide repeat protein [Methylococcales bacterium]MDP2391939.1 tetratricopeptide repeat protein [Methylococcaceae bacterium]MDP3018822.1 tetratricopeptide repeat protein [Methylococcaceae bacterium]MDP3391383.1 tetratricopeptide repeat protein [Methylococcaceae bacterium]
MSKQNEEHEIAGDVQICPRCSAREVRKSILHSRDSFLHKLAYRPYRCRACHLRYWEVSPLKVVVYTVLVGPILVLSILWLLTADRFTAETSAEAKQISTDNIEPVKEDGATELQMGLRYVIGDGVVKSPKEAASWFEKAANHGSAEGQYRFGLALQEGRGVLQDYKASFHWLEQAAQQGHPQAQYSYGQLYRAGIGVDVDRARAYLWFNLAAAQGVGEAASARDSLVWQLEPNQVNAMQAEARRLSQAISAKPSENTK